MARTETGLLLFTDVPGTLFSEGVCALRRRFYLTLALAGLCLQPLAAGSFTTRSDTPNLLALQFHDPSMPPGPNPANTDPEEPALRTDSTPVKPGIEDAWEADQPRGSTAPRIADWSVYIFPEEVMQLTGDRSPMDRLGLGGHQRFGQWVRLSGEISAGGGLAGAQVGGSCHLNERIQLYTNSGVDTKPGESAAPTLNGRLTSGAKWRVSEKAGVFAEKRLKNADGQRGGAHAFGLDLRPAPHWTGGTTLEMGELSDPSGGIRQRRAGGLSVGYARKGIRYGGHLELRMEESEGPARNEVWTARNDVEFQLADGWRLLSRLDASFGSAHEDSSMEGARIECWTELTHKRSGRDNFNVLMKYAVSPDSARDWETDLQLGLFGTVHEDVRVGVGYNFDHFSNGITEPSSDGRGWFLEIAGTF